MQANNGQQAAPGTSPAPSTSATETPDDRSSSFRAVKGGGETVHGGTLLIAAYAFVWIALFVVILNVFRKQTKTAERLAQLDDAIKSSKKAAREETPPTKAKKERTEPSEVEGAEGAEGAKG